MANLQDLEKQQKAAMAQRTKLASNLSKEFSQKTVDDLAGVQANLKTLSQKLEAAKKAEGSGTGGESCTITLIRGGKDDQTLADLPVETTLADALKKVNWDAQGMDFKRMVGPDVTEAITNINAATFGPGNHEIFVSPKVTGGEATQG